MAEKPQVGTDISDIGRGAGKLVDSNEMLKQQFNPAEYYYDKFKKENNTYLNDQMWVEAAKRGETMNLANLLSQRSALDAQKAQQPEIDTNEQTQPKVDEIDWMQKTKDYSKYLDYDTYILALSLPMYDNTTIKEKVEPSTGYKYGDYTDRQWAEEILKESFRRYDAIKQKEIQESRNWFESIGPAIAAGTERLVGHILEGIEAISDMGESVQNFFGIKVGLIPLIKQIVDGDNLWAKPVNERVLEPFAEDGLLNKAGTALEREAYKLEYDNLKHIVDPVEAYKQGYNRETGENWGAGYTDIGSIVTSVINSIGDMIPSIILTAGLPASTISKTALNTVRTSIFYSGVTSRDISSTVKQALANGLELKDIDAGIVISNAVVKSAAQWAVEIMLGKLIGFSNIDKLLGMGGESVSAIKHIGKTKIGALGIAGLNAIRDAAKEGLEEVLQDLSDTLINYMYGAIDGTIGDIYTNDANELSIQSLLQSFAAGALTSIVVSNVQRGIAMTRGFNLETIVDENGNVKKLGVFQTLNYNQAVNQLAEWHNILNDETADAKAKADAKLALEVTIDTLGEFFKSMNVDKTLFVNNLLTGASNAKQTNDEITKLSDTEYANKLYDNFIKDYTKLKGQTEEALKNKTSEKTSIFNKVKEGVKKLADKFKGNNITKFDNIVSEETINNLPDNVKSDIETLRKKLGLNALVSHNGSKGILDIENDIFYLPDNWLEDKDITTVVKQIGYAKVREGVRLALDSNQRKLILNIYNKITNSQNATIETALDALLFDNKMYASTLMVAAASNAQYKQNAVKLLSTIDQVAKKAALEQQKNNNLTTQAYKTLMNKIYQNMKVGFVNYFTTQERIIDIDSISSEVIPTDIKKEIKANKNIIISEIIDKATNVSLNTKSAPLSKEEKTNMLRTLKHYKTYIPQEIYDSAIKQLNSNEWSQQNDAGIMIALASWYVNAFDANSTMKAVYVMPSLLNDTNFAPLKANTFKALNEWLGIPVLDYIAEVHRNPYATLMKLNEEARNFFKQYDLTNAEDRYRAIDEKLWEFSNHTLTFTKDTYEVCQVMNKDEFLKPEYAGEDGHDNILSVLKDTSKPHYISDFLNDNVKLNRRFSNIEIAFDASANSDSFNPTTLVDENGINIETAYIIINGHSPIIESLLHEMTHGAQWAAGLNSFLQNTYGTNVEGARWEYSGGNEGTIKAGLDKRNTESLNNYIQKYFKTSYNYLSSLKELQNPNLSTVIYFLVDGEIQARTNLDSVFRVFGFTVKYDKVTKSYYLRGPIKENGKYPVWDLSNKGTIKETTQSSQAPRLSEETDNQGNQLTDAQVEFLKNSKARNKSGKIIEAYHATAKDFDVFDKKKIGSTFAEEGTGYGTYGAGFYFTTDEREADYHRLSALKTAYYNKEQDISNNGEGRIIKAYLNITNPAYVTNGVFKNQEIRDYVNKEYEKWKTGPEHRKLVTQYVISGGGTKEDAETLFNNLDQDRKQRIILGNFNTDALKQSKFRSKGDLYWFYPYDYKVQDTLKSLGFDGIITENLSGFVVFEPNQIKYTNNLSPSILPGMSQAPRLKRKVVDLEAQRKQKYKDNRAYISNKIAKDSNLRYFIKKGRPILMNKGVRDFIVSTTTDFDKLPTILRNKILNGTLTRDDISDYVATAANMDDYTFKAIAKYVYKNEALAEISFKDLKKLADRIDQFAAINKLGKLPDTIIVNEDESAYDRLMSIYKQVNELANKDIDGFGKRLQNKLNYANKLKVNNNYIEMSADPKTLQPMFFNHYDGTLESLTAINNLGKYMAFMLSDNAELIENTVTGEIEGEGGESSWQKQYKTATKNYEYKDLDSTLNSISLDDKLLAIENYYADIAIKNLSKMTDEQRAKYTPAAIKRSLNSKMQAIKNMSDTDIDALYMKTIAAEIQPNIKSAEKIFEDMKKAPRSKKNVKDTLRNAATSLTKYISKKSIYNKLSDTTKKYIDWRPTGARLNLNYQTLSNTELNNVIEAFRADRDTIKKSTYEEAKTNKTTKFLERQLRGMERKYKEATKKLSKAEFDKLSLKEKLKAEQTKYRYKTKNFNAVSDIKANDTVTQLLNTNWSEKTRMSTVKELTNNAESDVANFKTFFEENSETLLSSDLNSIEDAVKWFIEAIPTMNTIEDYKKYQAVKVMFLSYVFGETKEGGLYANMNNNLKSEIENTLSKEARVAGTTLSVWQQSLKLVDPLKTMTSQAISLDGIELTPELKEELFVSIKSDDIKLIEKTQQDIIKYINENKTVGKSFAKRVIAYRSLSMLSSPITWLRNKVSNMIIKPLNKLASKIGTALFKGHTQQGQLKLNKQITPEIQNYITKNFIDNGMYDTLVKNISKYNPSDISEKYKDVRGKANKEAIITSLVLKSMYNQYYNENMFKTKAFNKLYNFLMNRLSDDSYVREASIRYFGKILAEKGYTLTNEITDDIMNDFASSLGLALADYMHSDNFFNKFETAIKDNEAAWVAYKAILPFASASWNWFKGAMKYTPFGLGRAIVKFGRLEESVRKAETSWNEGINQIAPELTEYMIRRDIGQGIIGTIGWGLGVMLAALGIIRLNKDDYDIPKLEIGNLTIDISSIFGTNSILAGAAMMQGITDGDLMDGLNKAGKVLLDNMPLMEILEIDMYSSGPADIFVDYLQQSLLSFIPNGIAWLAGATYSGNLKKDSFWKRAVAKIPFLNTALAASGVLDKKVNVYTGSTGSYMDALNRLIPYFSYQIASTNERKTTALGLNKTMLRGQYTINGQSFVVTGTNLQKLNEKYGQWNAEDLTNFYSNKTKVKVKVGNSYKIMSYSQMNDGQRKNAVQNIMSNNAELTKIVAWLSKGHKYYASDETYKKLISKGIKKNVYKGTKGFVE